MSGVLLEGGNVFKAPGWSKQDPQMLTDRISRSEVAPTVEHIEALLGLPLEDNLLGSTGVAESSGDIDIAIDATRISKDAFENHLLKTGVDPEHIVKTGDSVHYMSPIYNEQSEPTDRFVQVDFMFVPSVEFVKWSMRTAPDSTYKGVYLQKLRADLTNTVAPKDSTGKSQWKWNHFKGVLNRSDESPVFGEFDPDAIAKGLLGPSATRKDLESVEGVMRLLKDNERRKEVIDTYRQTLARDPKGTQLPPDEQLNKDYLEENHVSPVQINELKVGQATKRLMAQQKQDKKQSSVGREFQHIEDLVYIEGISGVNRALYRLAQIAKNSKPLEVKWDGSPAIIFGRDENGTFHFGDKYAKQMLTNPREVYEYYTRSSQSDSRKQFALEMAELCPVYAAATPKNFRGFIEAGLMYKTTPPQNERGEYYFTPNTVTYFVDSGSALGERIGNSTSGAAATGTFDKLPELGGQRRPVGDVYKHISGDRVVIIPPKFTDTATQVDVDKLRTISRYAASVAQPLEQFIQPEQGLSDIRGIIYRYVNSQVDDPQNLGKLGHNFVEWVKTSGVVSQPKQEKILKRIESNTKGANAVFKLVQAIMHIKDGIIGAKETETLGSLGIRAQLKSGEHGGEGFVHDPDEGVGPTKLVNRGTFTRANRLRESAGDDSYTVNSAQARKALLAAFKVKRPVFLWGPPGIGKSEVVEEIIKEIGGAMINLRMDQMEPTDIRGVPFYNKKLGKMDWRTPESLPTEESASRYPIVVLFLDEKDSSITEGAPPSVRAAAYQLAINRRVGKYVLPDNVVVVIGGNTASNYRLPLPLTNRFVQVKMEEPTIDNRSSTR